jgi:hypothetical protein
MAEGSQLNPDLVLASGSSVSSSTGFVPMSAQYAIMCDRQFIGDRKYGVSSDPARRLALHSCELKFRHPVSGASMEFPSGLPSQLKQLIEPRVAHARSE